MTRRAVKNKSCLGRYLSHPSRYAGRKTRKASYDKSTNGTWFQRRKNRSADPTGAAHDSRPMVVRPHAADRKSGDGLGECRRAPAGAGLASRRPPRRANLEPISQIGRTSYTSSLTRRTRWILGTRIARPSGEMAYEVSSRLIAKGQFPMDDCRQTHPNPSQQRSR